MLLSFPRLLFSFLSLCFLGEHDSGHEVKAFLSLESLVQGKSADVRKVCDPVLLFVHLLKSGK